MHRSSEHSVHNMRGSGEPAALDPATRVNAGLLAERWWSIALRGVAAVIFGLVALFLPMPSLFALVILFGAYAIVDGIFNLVMAGRGARQGRPWGSLVFAGIASVTAGVLTFMWPRITALALVLLIAAWSIVHGISEIVAAIRLRKQIRGEWLLGLIGALSVTFGVLLVLFPGAGALTLVLWIGAYAVVFGALLIGLGLKLRSWGRASEQQQHMPARGVA